MTTVAWWNCFAGIAGDMALASLIDAGADIDEVVAGLEGLPVSGWHIEVAKTTRAGLAATQLRVDVDPASDRTERTWGTIGAVIDQAPRLPERARTRAQKVFARLASAEGRLHGLPPEEVHFHEVGGLDAIVDVVGTCLALESLGVGSVRSGQVALGTGTVHGPRFPRPVAQPSSRCGRAARGSTSPGCCARRGADHPYRRRPARRFGRVLWAAAANEDNRQRLRRRQAATSTACRTCSRWSSVSCEPRQLRKSRFTRTLWCSKPTWTTSPERCWPTLLVP